MPVVNIYKQWGVVYKDTFAQERNKELPTHDFAGEDGEDTYIPSFIPKRLMT